MSIWWPSPILGSCLLLWHAWVWDALSAAPTGWGRALCSAAAAHEGTGSQSGKAHDADDADTSGLMPAEELRALIEEFKDVLVHELPPGLPPDRYVPHTIFTEV